MNLTSDRSPTQRTQSSVRDGSDLSDFHLVLSRTRVPVDLLTGSPAPAAIVTARYAKKALPLLMPPATEWDSVFVSSVETPTDITVRLHGAMYSEKLTALETKMNRIYATGSNF